jgi:membrane complex biogenesis BtpA family protein
MLKLLKAKKAFIGVVHLPATPGAPRYSGDRRSILRRATDDARALIAGGVDAIVVENFGDAPFFAEHVPAETVASLALAIDAVQQLAGDLPVGVNVLRNDARAALGVAAATGARFVRINVHIGAAVTDQGLIQGRAAETLRERERLCPGVALLCDVHVKHATPLGRESLADAARDTLLRGLADALIVSGVATGSAPEPEHLLEVHEAAPSAPLLVGSGFDERNARKLLVHASGAIVGTALKKGGLVGERVELERVKRMREFFDSGARKAKA